MKRLLMLVCLFPVGNVFAIDLSKINPFQTNITKKFESFQKAVSRNNLIKYLSDDKQAVSTISKMKNEYYDVLKELEKRIAKYLQEQDIRISKLQATGADLEKKESYRLFKKRLLAFKENLYAAGDSLFYTLGFTRGMFHKFISKKISLNEKTVEVVERPYPDFDSAQKSVFLLRDKIKKIFESLNDAKIMFSSGIPRGFPLQKEFDSWYKFLVTFEGNLGIQFLKLLEGFRH